VRTRLSPNDILLFSSNARSHNALHQLAWDDGSKIWANENNIVLRCPFPGAKAFIFRENQAAEALKEGSFLRLVL
jgi:hypothetical protein